MPNRGPRGRSRERHVVGIGEVAVTRNHPPLVTYALGSCVGVAVHDPITGIGGLLHAALPDSDLNPARAREEPGRFVDTGIDELLRQVSRLGVMRGSLVVKVAGGARMSAVGGGEGAFRVGARNITAVRSRLEDRGLTVDEADLGGSRSRTVRLDPATGRVTVESRGREVAI